MKYLAEFWLHLLAYPIGVVIYVVVWVWTFSHTDARKALAEQIKFANRYFTFTT